MSAESKQHPVLAPIAIDPIDYDVDALHALRDPENRGGPVLRWDWLRREYARDQISTSHSISTQVDSFEDQDLIEYAQTLSPEKLQTFYSNGPLSESDLVEICAALPLGIVLEGKAQDYLRVSLLNFPRLKYRPTPELRRVRGKDRLIEIFLTFSLLHPEAKIPSSKIPAKDIDPIIALDSLSRTNVERGLDIVNLLTDAELRALTPKKLAQIKEGITHGLAKQMRNEIVWTLTAAMLIMGGVGDHMVKNYSNEGIRASARGMMNVCKSMLENPEFINLSDSDIVAVADGKNPKLARKLTEMAAKIVADNPDKIASFYAYVPAKADQRLTELLRASDNKALEQASHHARIFETIYSFNQILNEIKDLNKIYDSASSTTVFQKTKLKEALGKLIKLRENSHEFGATDFDVLQKLDATLVQVSALFQSGEIQAANDLLLSESETLQTQLDEEVQTWQRDSRLFDFYTAITTPSDLLSDAERTKISVALQKVFQNTLTGLTPDTEFLKELIILSTFFDDAQGKSANPGGKHYPIVNEELREVAEAALRKEKKNVAEPAPTQPEVAGGEDITEGVYKSEVFGEAPNSLGIVMGVDAKADIYFKNLEDFRKKFLVALAAILGTVVTFSTRRFRNKFVEPIEQMMPVVAALGRGELDVDFSDLPVDRKDEIGALARILRHLAEVNHDIIAAMVDPIALKRVIQYWDRPEELFGLKELDTAICFTDTRNSTALYQKLGNQYFQQLIGMLNNDTARGFVAGGNIRTNKFDGDGLILTQSDEPGKEKTAASKMMKGAVEGYRQAYTVNYIAQKFGCHTADIRFGVHYGKIYTGLQQYLDTPKQAYQQQVSTWFQKVRKLLWSREGVSLAGPQGNKLHRIIEGMEGLGISIASRYQPASKSYTHFTISPDLFTEIIPHLQDIPHIKTIGEKRDVCKSEDVKNAISVHDVEIDVSDLTAMIDAIFADPENQKLIEEIKAEIQRDAPQFFLDEQAKGEEERYADERATNLKRLNFHALKWWQERSKKE